MDPTERTNRIQNPVHLVQFHTVHLAVQFFKGCLDLGIFHLVAFAISLVQHSKHRIPVADVRLVLGDIPAQYIIKVLNIDLQND